MNRRTFLAGGAAMACRAAALEVRFIPLLPPGPGNPRNTEGAFLKTADGRLLFAYTKFTGGGADHDSAVIAMRSSRDGGLTWSAADEILVPNSEASQNVMSVSFLRLRDGRAILFYLRKNSDADCRVYQRVSRDQGRTWSEPRLCIPDTGYYVLNNDRAVELKRGRIVLPVSQRAAGEKRMPGRAMAYLSDDGGATWRRSRSEHSLPENNEAGLQEPGVVELKGGRLMMFCRTTLGSQYISYSPDGGETWSEPGPSSLISPLSPASIKRIPKTRDLLAVWNDHSGPHGDGRTPLTAAISRDEGRTWINRQNLRDDPRGWYCYTAIEFAGDNALLCYNSGGLGGPRLAGSELAIVPVKFLYRRQPNARSSRG